jgi:hypothetical protein
MIWFFGTSHTDGFADGVKHQDTASYPELVGNQTGQPVINFGTSGAQNLQIFDFIKIVASDKTIQRPDAIIIEPRLFYDHVSFPRLTLEGDMTHETITWRSDSDAYYSGWWNDFLKMYACWQKTTSTRKRQQQHHDHLRFWSTNDGTDTILQKRTLANKLKWVEREPFDYTEWCGEWYDSKQQLVTQVEEQSHPYALLKLEQELMSMIFAAQTVTDCVGIFFWGNDIDNKKEITNKFKGIQTLKPYNILGDQTVHQVLAKNHRKQYLKSQKTYIDAHLGPEAHDALAPYISNWIKNWKK